MTELEVVDGSESNVFDPDHVLFPALANLIWDFAYGISHSVRHCTLFTGLNLTQLTLNPKISSSLRPLRNALYSAKRYDQAVKI